MPNDPMVWIVAILAGAVVVLVGLSLGGVLDVGVNPPRLRFTRKAAPAQERVDVLSKAKIDQAKAGHVTGAEVDGETDGNLDISVLSKAQITKSELGDITGVRIAQPKREKDG